MNKLNISDVIFGNENNNNNPEMETNINGKNKSISVSIITLGRSFIKDGDGDGDGNEMNKRIYKSLLENDRIPIILHITMKPPTNNV